MTLDDKVDLVLNKLNGSEGSVLRTDIQAWLPDGQSNPVDNQLIIDTLQTNDLIRLRSSNNADTFIITARGRRMNDKGGWKKHMMRKSRNQIIKNLITYTNIAFAALNLGILLYSLIQDDRIEKEVERLRSDLEQQHAIKDMNGTKIDSLASVIVRQSKIISNLDSINKTQSQRKN